MIRPLLSLILLVAAALGPSPVQAQALPGPCEQGALPGGALALFCIPANGWNRDLVIWAPGYTAADEPLRFRYLVAGASLPQLAQTLGFAFATTSYRQNGLAVLEGVEDVRELLDAFVESWGWPRHTLLLGLSEGALVVTLALERTPEVYSGGLALCGPIGSFRKQLDYLGDFRALFDYFFPEVIPGSPVSIPEEVIDRWASSYVKRIGEALAGDPTATAELATAATLPVDPTDLEALEAAATQLLWYNVFGTNDAIEKLGGNPYDNQARRYLGSADDVALNEGVLRLNGDEPALATLAQYETSGAFRVPLITLHTTGDEVVPQWHQELYGQKAEQARTTTLAQSAVDRSGHCNFTPSEVLSAFRALVEGLPAPPTPRPTG